MATDAFFFSVLGACLREFGRIAWVLPVLTLVEVALPASRCSLESRLRGAVYWLIWVPVAALTITAFQVVWAKTGIEPLLKFDLLPPSGAPAFVRAAAIGGGVLLSWVISDFFFYWYHRAQHAWFWRFHRVHHAIREMSAINCVQHIADEAIRVAFMVLPLALLVRLSLGDMLLLSIWSQMQGQFIHTATRLHLGPLRRVLNDNRFHRIHHSMERQHWSKNFGGATTIWDQVFGTAYFPKPGEWPETGLPDFDDPETVKDYLLAPLKPVRAATSALVNPI